MEIKIISLITLILTLIFFLIKREILYSAVSLILFLVALPLIINFEVLTTKHPSITLFLDYSPSSKDKVGYIEKSLPLQEFDYIRRFGIPYNKPEELKAIQNLGEIIVILSDFLFEVPEDITKNTNIILVYIEDKVKTNHSIKSISITNISQTEYLSIETLFPSEITITDKNKKLLFKGIHSTNHLIPTINLPDKVIISSLKTNILISIPKTPQIGIIWYELNQDLRIFLGVLRELGYTYELIPKIKEKINIPEKKYKNLVIGYPDESINIEKIFQITEDKSKIIIISPHESFIKNLISFSPIRNLTLKPEDFIYREELKLFNLNYNYPVKIKEALRYNFPKVHSKTIPLDKHNTTIYLNLSEREMIIILLKELYTVDIENLKFGVYSSFSQEIFSELTKFFEIPEIGGEINLQETAFEGGIKPKGNVIHYKDLSKEFLEKIKNNNSSTIMEKKEVNVSTLWIVMVGILVLLGLKWLLKK